MIAFIDQSPHWKGCRTPPPREWIRVMEAWFCSHPERRPASRLEVFLLSRALSCPEASIARFRAASSVRRVRAR
jgi:hypothetical protein